ncbi:formate dehydrogenase subunit gamma [Limobrevibacterium gyesilva]|uniref:Formate dehydrogenase subunit gamma n=1 Tax=Limobrevibacterium gyesilva TaxID=2991712 RepID=A0AA42CCX9_9PROT|nr:formate dehydrogenase subunit gamma [Limobrevibacterium gyesilva]MCW3474153.1 formate dehydrogenase subunit gamma [Limobrevibacterium gyesilva]
MRIVLLAVLALWIGTSPGQAQPQNAPVSGFNPTASSVSEDQLLQALDRVTGRVSIPDKKSATLEQPAGRIWRDYHRSWLPWIGGVLVLGTLAALAVFYFVRGRIRLEGGRSGRTILRFTSFERFMHWLTAFSWLVLALSGLNVAYGRRLVLPLIGEDAFSRFSQLAKYSHNFVAFPFTLGIVLMFLVWLRHNIPDRTDVEWVRQGGGIIGHAHPPAGKFNAGQKAVFWIVVLGGAAVAVTGYLLLFPFYVTDIAGQQLAQVVHGVVALMMIAAMLGHIYIGTLGMEDAFDAMATGEVDLNWARAHHSLWVEEELARAARPPSGAAPAE